MTHATIHHIDANTMAVEFAYDKDLKEAIAAMVGGEWDKGTKRWLLPISRLGDVVKLFWPNVTLDYEVLRARDEQLKRMFRQWQSLGVRFWLDAGKVRSSHAMLDGWFVTNGNRLHAVALEAVLVEQPAPIPVRKPVAPPAPAPEDPGLAIWLRGVKNAAAAEEKKVAMLAAQKRRRVNA